MNLKTLKWVVLAGLLASLVVGFSMITNAEKNVLGSIVGGLVIFSAGYHFSQFLKIRSEERVRADIRKMIDEECKAFQREIEEEAIHFVSNN